MTKTPRRLSSRGLAMRSPGNEVRGLCRTAAPPDEHEPKGSLPSGTSPFSISHFTTPRGLASTRDPAGKPAPTGCSVVTYTLRCSGLSQPLRGFLCKGFSKEIHGNLVTRTTCFTCMPWYLRCCARVPSIACCDPAVARCEPIRFPIRRDALPGARPAGVRSHERVPGWSPHARSPIAAIAARAPG